MQDQFTLIEKEKSKAYVKMPSMMTAMGTTVESTVVPTAAVDKEGNIYINPAGLETMHREGFPVGYVVCHEVLHYALKHVERGEGKNHEFWNIACDAVVEAMLRSVFNWSPPEQYVTAERFNLPPDGTAEEYYAILVGRAKAKGNSEGSPEGSPEGNPEGSPEGSPEGNPEGNPDGNAEGNANGKASGQGMPGGNMPGGGFNPKNVGNSLDEDRPWEEGQASAGAGTQDGAITKPRIPKDYGDRLAEDKFRHPDIKQASKRCRGFNPGSALNEIEAGIEIDYRLFEYLTNEFRFGDYSYSRPRYHLEPIITPGYYESYSIGVIVDTSGSMAYDLPKVMAYINGLLSNGVKVTLVQADVGVVSCTELYGVASSYEIKGYGGTSMRQAYLDAIELLRDVDTVVMFTDGETDWPQKNELVKPLVVVLVNDARVPEYIPTIKID